MIVNNNQHTNSQSSFNVSQTEQSANKQSSIEPSKVLEVAKTNSNKQTTNNVTASSKTKQNQTDIKQDKIKNIETQKQPEISVNNSNDFVQKNKNDLIKKDGMVFSGLQVVNIGAPKPESNEGLMLAASNFDANGFSSQINKDLYNYELNRNNQEAAMNEAIQLHGGNPDNTCVFFQSSCLRAIGQDVPDYIGYTTHLENWLGNNGWVSSTNFNNIQKGDIVFASYYHTFCFMGWKDKAAGEAYVMGNESYSEGSAYSNRNLNGQAATAQDGWNNQYKATIYWRYPGQQIQGPASSQSGNQTNTSNPNINTGNTSIIGQATVTNSTEMMSSPNTTVGSIDLGSISAGTTIYVTAVHNGWLQFTNNNGVSCWIEQSNTTGFSGSNTSNNSNTNSSSSSSNSSTATVNSPIGLWLLGSPSMQGSQIECMPANADVTVIQTQGAWTEVDYNGTTGWCYNEYLNMPAITSNTSTSNSTNNTSANNNSNSNSNSNTSNNSIGTVNSPIGLWLLGSPSMEGSKIQCIPANGQVTILQTQGAWTEVNYNGTTGWCYNEYLNMPAVTSSTSTSNSTNNISNNNNTSTNSSNNTSSNSIGTVNSPIGLWLLGSPSMQGSQIECMPANGQVTILQTQGAWTEVNYNGTTGWCYNEYLNISAATSNNTNNTSTSNSTSNTSNNNNTSTNSSNNTSSNSIGTVSSPIGLWLLGSPSMQGSKIQCMPANGQVSILQTQGAWTEVDYNGTTGWCYNEYLDMSVAVASNTNNTSNSSNISSNANVSTGTVSSPIGLWLLGSPSMQGSKIECMPGSTQVSILQTQGAWTEVNYNGTTGWCYNEYLNMPAGTQDLAAIPAVNQGQTTTVTVQWLCLNKNPKPNDGIITYLKKGNVVKILETNNNGWYKVNYNGTIGWIGAKYTTGINN